MTYFDFLIVFLLLPIIAFSVLVFLDHRKDTDRYIKRGLRPVGYTFLLLVIISVIYTTLWDNYLVATQVWWYDPTLVMGITIGWVPLEEYLFFILQPILVGLWMLILLSRAARVRRISGAERNIRPLATISAISIWITSLLLLFLDGSRGNYLGLELAWALPAVIFQLAFGADILWRRWSLIFWSIVPMTIYLSLADAFAISSGIWTISPTQSSGILLGGILPLEEFVFFLLTNSLVAFGFVLFWSPKSYARFKGILNKLPSGNRKVSLQEE